MSRFDTSCQETQPGVPGPLEIHRLLRGLLDQLEGMEGKDQIVLDLVMDGFRCVVTRLAEEPVAAGMPHMSPREIEIARMVAKGFPNKTIAAVLEISSWTVSTHLRRMFAKLGVTSRAAMVARVMETPHPRTGPAIPADAERRTARVSG